MQEGEFRHVAAQLVSALAHAHSRGVAHGDLKPENMMYNARTKTVAVGDWGSAVAVDGWHVPEPPTPGRMEEG